MICGIHKEILCGLSNKGDSDGGGLWHLLVRGQVHTGFGEKT